MKKGIILFISFCLTAHSWAQITNGSFETFHQLPTSLGGWNAVEHWNNCGSNSAHPDYYHLQGNSVIDLPETPTAIVSPSHGSAIMGLAISGNNNTEKREYLSTQLASPLTIGQKYYLSYRITNGEITSSSLAGLAVNHIGILLSTTAQQQTGNSPISAQPQLTIDSVLYTSKWQRIDFEFIADQPYQFLTFGLFGVDSQHSIVRKEGTNPQVAYYFIDDFILSTIPIPEDPIVEEPQPPYTDPPKAPFFVPNAFTPNGDADNDIFMPVEGYIKHWELEVFTKWGDPVFFSKNPQKGWDGNCKGIPCANGSYIWKISYQAPGENGEISTQVEYGFVNLVK